MEMNVVPVVDHKKNIQFWIEAISNPDISKENKVMLNECLNRELNLYVLPLGNIPIDNARIDCYSVTASKFAALK